MGVTLQELVSDLVLDWIFNNGLYKPGFRRLFQGPDQVLMGKIKWPKALL
jgi:hypothetical protein